MNRPPEQTATDVGDDQLDLLDQLADEFLSRCRAGEAPSVEEYAAKHPSLASDIRELFPTIVTVEQARSAATGGSAVRSAVAPSLEKLEDFRIIRELGRGGMGIVYEAEQKSLGRRVAIKILPRQYIGDQTRVGRFLREARTAARLHHTSIVPIFSVGMCEGDHYFVMQYIRGVGLDSIIRTAAKQRGAAGGPPRADATRTAARDVLSVARSLIDKMKPTTVADGASAARSVDEPPIDAPTSVAPASLDLGAPPIDPPRELIDTSVGADRHWRSIAAIIAQAADALDHAHAQGVLHRDIKPSNLLLDEHGTLWITDFGLARAGAANDLTRTGDVIGTLRYMAPEQFSGQGDTRADIYALGMTLYELATLRPAFGDRDAKTLMKSIIDAALTPPRRIEASIPRDLETIILKAVSREPRLRYPSAAAMRDDLRRFVDDLPVLARRISLPERVLRWARRSPALAAMSALALISLVGVASVSSTAYFRVSAANRTAQSALAAETEQRQRAEAVASVAVDALDAAFEDAVSGLDVGIGEFGSLDDESATASDSPPRVVSPETAGRLETMLRCYERLAEQKVDSALLRRRTAAAQERVGAIYEQLARYADAREAYGRARAMFNTIAASEGESVEAKLELARIDNRLGRICLSLDEPEPAREFFAAAIESLRTITVRGGDDAKFELALAHYLLAQRPTQGVPDVAPPRGPLERLIGGGSFFGTPPDPPPMGGRGEGPGPRGGPRGPGPGPRGARTIRDDAARPNEPRMLEDSRREAIRILERLVTSNADNARYRYLLARCLREMRPGNGGPAEPPDAGEPGSPAGDPLARAARILESLAEKHPLVPEYRYDLALTYARQDRGEDGPARVDRAIEMLSALGVERPGEPRYRYSLAQVCQLRAKMQADRRNTNEALQLARRAVEIQVKLAEQYPDVGPYAVAASFHESNLGRLLITDGKYDEARRSLGSAISRIEAQSASVAERPHVRAILVMSLREMGRSFVSENQPGKAREWFDKAAKLRPGPPDEGPPRGERP